MGSVGKTVAIVAIWAAIGYIATHLSTTEFTFVILMLCGTAGSVAIAYAGDGEHCCAENGCFEEDEEEKTA